MSEPARTQRFAEVALPHLDAAYNLARWLVRSDCDAEDIVQEAYLRAFKAFDGFRGANGRPWLLAIVRNASYDWLQQRRADNATISYDEELHDGHISAEIASANEATVNPETALARADDRRLVNAALARLPTAFREVVVLRDIEDLSYRDIAAIANIPIGTVMSRLARGRKLMLAYLERPEA